MPLRHKSAQKRARQTPKKTEYNKHFKAKIKSALKNVTTAKKKDEAEKELKKAVTVLDRAAVKGIIHRNNAANKKSKLTKAVNKMK
ncbi:MAG: 30S ribosomal protein S20 [Ignavibacteria bacterium]|nr:30S ribosomal protein S20 [Ignavibacteria bacterium]MCC7157957.1 30S ribosomal protein S20 [Ignavibacteria bacterium]